MIAIYANSKSMYTSDLCLSCTLKLNNSYLGGCSSNKFYPKIRLRLHLSFPSIIPYHKSIITSKSQKLFTLNKKIITSDIMRFITLLIIP